MSDLFGIPVIIDETVPAGQVHNKADGLTHKLIGIDHATKRDVGIVQIGPHRLYHGDAYQIRETLGWQDVDFMDPPYLIRAQGGGHYRKRRKSMEAIIEEKLDKGFDLSIINPLRCGSVIVFSHNDQLPSLLTHLAGNFYRTVLCVWQKTNPQPVANKNYRPDCEFYTHAWQDGNHPVGSLLEKNRITLASPPRGKATFGHPTVKPDKLMDKIMANVNGQTICDPFMGTGSTGVAAIKAGKTFTGIEHNPKHFQTAVLRISAAYEAHAA